jgi:hypothetical protein
MSRRNAMHAMVLIAVIAGASLTDATGEQSQRAEGKFNGRSVVAAVRLSDPARCANPESWSWGADQQCPRSAVSLLTVECESKSVFIPVSAYADLAAVSSVKLLQASHGFKLEIRGGDAASSYNAVLEFVWNQKTSLAQLRRRVVRNNEFPDEAYEATDYKYAE